MGSDIFTHKCEAHNVIVEYRRTCPVCVSTKRAQLHAANMARMPRYLFEQTLDVRATTPNPCLHVEVSSTSERPATHMVSSRSCYYPGYYQLKPSVQTMVQHLDNTKDVEITRVRLHYQELLDTVTLTARDLALTNAAAALYDDLMRLSGGAYTGAGVKQSFIAFVADCMRAGQKLVPVKTTETIQLDDASLCVVQYVETVHLGLAAEKSLLERDLDRYRYTSAQIRDKFRIFVNKACNEYYSARRPATERVNAQTMSNLIDYYRQHYNLGHRCV